MSRVLKVSKKPKSVSRPRPRPKSVSRPRSNSVKKTKKKPSKCKQYLSDKIAENIREGKFKTRQQAIAVAFSQVKKSHPQCKRFIEKN